MHYLPKIINQNGLFQRLGSVLQRKNKTQARGLKIERFLYRASSVLVSLEAIKQAEETTVMLIRNYLKQIKFPKNKRIAISTESLFQIYAHFPSALSALVIMQNQLLDIVKGILEIDISTPSSLGDAVEKKGGLKRFGFDKQVQQLIESYWQESGKYIRAVRDINEHFDALVDQTFFEYRAEPGMIFVFFPDNPEVKSPSKFTYKLEKDAYETVATGLKAISDLIDEICTIKEISPRPFQPGLALNQVGDLAESQERTLGLMIEVQNIERTDKGTRLVLDTIEIMQVIPKEGKGNLAVRKMKTDSETEGDKPKPATTGG